MCRDAFRKRLSAYVDGELGLVARVRIAWHLRRCESCASEWMALHRLNTLLREADVAPRSRFHVKTLLDDVASLSSAPDTRPAATASGNRLLSFLIFGEAPRVARVPLRLVFPSLALFALVILGVAPATRSVIQHHIRAELLHSMPKWDPALTYEFARRHPGDLQIQMAVDSNPSAYTTRVDSRDSNTSTHSNTAREQQSNLDNVQRLKTLAHRFPNAPEVYANELRYLTNGLVKLDQREAEMTLAHDLDKLKDANQLAEKQKQAKDAPDHGALMDFEAAAEAGERLDPDNAYFPMMHAISLFALHRDPEARQALQRASQKLHWEDYSLEEATGQLRIQTAMFGEQNALDRTATNAAVLLPQYTPLRATARLTMYFAKESEKAGHYEEGLRIRGALMRCGSLMRLQSRLMIGSGAGITISNIAMSDPGGKRDSDSKKEMSREQRMALRLQNYCAYLERIGHEDEARLTKAEIVAGDIANSSMDPGRDIQWQSLVRLEMWNGASLLILSNMLIVLLLGGIATLAARIKPHSRLLVLRYVGLLVLALGVGTWQYQMIDRGLTLPLNLLSNEAGNGGKFSLILFLFASMTPLWITLSILAISRRWHMPLLQGLNRGWRAFALPIAVILVLVYANSVVYVARQEAQVSAGIDRALENEGRYMAELGGKPWPGPTYGPAYAGAGATPSP